MNNIILLTDSYKASHYKQYPPKTEQVYSYFESRGGKFQETVFFGLQYLLKEYLSKPVIREDLDEALDIYSAHLGPGVFNYKGWDRLLTKHDGFLPIRIRAVAEGTVVPVQNVLMTVENTDPEFYWLTNYLETLLVQTWYPITVATNSREMKKTILRALMSTGDPAAIDFKLHDFGFRGVSSVESSMIGGMAHLVNFMGTDTVSALAGAKKYYDCGMAGFSIPASEHSTITSWGREGEVNAFRNMLEQYPKGLVACVSDSYNVYEACSQLWGTDLRKQIMEREGTLVIRPDSGNPKEVILSLLSILGQKFGYKENAKGYKVLDSHVRLIQGDGVDYESIGHIIGAMTAAGWSTDNIAFGMGGGLLQKLDRDSQKFAFKCSSVTVDGQQREVFKDPVEAKWKSSKKGKLALVDVGDRLMTTAAGVVRDEQNLLKVVFENGQIKQQYTLEQVRKNAEVRLEE